MKTTIDVPDELYRRVKARSAMLGLAVREVTIDLYRRWLGDSDEPVSPAAAEQWLAEWRESGRSYLDRKGGRDASPSASEILETDRSRLDRS